MNILRLTPIVCLLVMACSSKSQDAGTSDDVDSRLDWSFERFFAKFSSDSNFQASRITFPVKHSHYYPPRDRTIKTQIEREQWKNIDFAQDSSSKTREFGKYSVDIVRSRLDKAIYDRRGIDNDIWEQYFFEKKEGKWFLVEIQNHTP